MPHDRDVAGIRCLEVLEVLSDYVDGELDRSTRARVDAQLAGCDWCERFGGRFAGVVGELRRHLAPAPPLGPELAARLRARLGLSDGE